MSGLGRGLPHVAIPLVGVFALAAIVAANRLRGPRRRLRTGLRIGAAAVFVSVVATTFREAPVRCGASVSLDAGATAETVVARLLPTIAALVAYAWGMRADGRLRRALVLEFLTPLALLLARPGFGRGRTERAVEVPWVLGRVGDLVAERAAGAAAMRILEIGHAFAEPFYLDALVERLADRPAALFGLDLVPKRVPGLHAVAGDLRMPPFRDGSFDLVLCVSTIEHVGRDNTRYGLPLERVAKEDVAAQEANAARALGALLAPGGRALVTVPFGRHADHGWLLNHSRDDLDCLIRASGLDVVGLAFFAYDDGWRRARADEIEGRDYGGGGAPGASAVACLELGKPAVREPDRI